MIGFDVLTLSRQDVRPNEARAPCLVPKPRPLNMVYARIFQKILSVSGLAATGEPTSVKCDLTPLARTAPRVTCPHPE